MTLLVRRRMDQPAQPWRNGGGVTREIASAPGPPADGSPGGGDFDWRVSVAEVERPGPFSTFTGVDRVIVLVDGPVMRLTVDGRDHDLRPWQPFGFDGGRPTSCALPAGPTRDLNVMTRRGRVRARVDVVELGGDPSALGPADPLLLVALAGPVTLLSPTGAPARLEPLDAAQWTGGRPLDATGPGAVLAVSLRPW